MDEITKKIVDFRDARDWKQFHNPKDLSLSLVLESAEVMEHFQWKTAAEIEKHIKTSKKEIGKELADVLWYLLLLGHDLNIDIEKALQQKLAENKKRYSVAKAKGNHKKYTELNK